MILKEKFSYYSYFLYMMTDLSYEHPPTTEFFLHTLLHHRSQMGLFGEQNRPEYVQTDMSVTVLFYRIH